MKKTFYLFILSLLTVPVTVCAQSGYEYDGKKIFGGARTASLGGAGVAEAADASSMYWNPAAMSFVSHSSIVASSILEWNREAVYGTVSLPPLSLGRQQVLILGGTGSVYGKDLTQPYFTYSGIDLGYAIKFYDVVSVGFLTNIRYGKTRLYGIGAASTSLGVFYAPSPGITYGLSFEGIGMGINNSFDGNENKIYYARSLEKSLHIGSTFRFPSLYREAYIAILLESQKIFNKRGATYRAGIETYPFHFLKLRGGLIAGSGSVSGTMGGGITFGRFGLDYAVSPSTKISRFHQMSAWYEF
jgi:hypothetical protein